MSRIVYTVLSLLLVIASYGQRAITVTAVDSVSNEQVLTYDLYDNDDQFILPSDEAGQVIINLSDSQTKHLTLSLIHI